MNSYLFVNPFSGKYDQRSVDTAVKRLNTAGIFPEVCTVKQTTNGRSIFQIINSSASSPLVIVAAGDGTINEVINGLNPEAATLAVLPMGTSNVLARELGIASLDKGIDLVIGGATKPLSVGVIELEGISRRFVLMAGIGFDGAVVRDVSLHWKRLLKQGAYGLSAIKNCVGWDSEQIRVNSGDRSFTCHSVIISNAARYGGSFVLAPEGSVSAPGLTAVCIQKSSRSGYLRLACDLFLGRAAASPAVLRIPVDECDITGRKPVQIDGDFIGYSPARLKTLPNFARIIS